MPEGPWEASIASAASLPAGLEVLNYRRDYRGRDRKNSAAAEPSMAQWVPGIRETLRERPEPLSASARARGAGLETELVLGVGLDEECGARSAAGGQDQRILLVPDAGGAKADVKEDEAVALLRGEPAHRPSNGLRVWSADNPGRPRSSPRGEASASSAAL